MSIKFAQGINRKSHFEKLKEKSRFGAEKEGKVLRNWDASSVMFEIIKIN